VRGSIPTPLTSEEIENKVERAVRRAKDYDFSQKGAFETFMKSLPLHTRGTYGGNTPCVEVQTGNPNSRIVFDAGSGIRALGNHLMEGGFPEAKGHTHLFLSHTHWDHIQGFPFYAPAFASGNRITVYSHVSDMENRLDAQQVPEFFPVSMDHMPADITFVTMTDNQPVSVGDIHVSSTELNHPGSSYAFRAESAAGAIVYASDTEFTDLSEIDVDKYVSFFSEAKVFIFDAQYFLSEAVIKEDWGHSPSLRGVDLACEAGVETLVLFHHEPTYHDRLLLALHQRTQTYAEMQGLQDKLNIIMAYEGLELDV
jgi:phosphoribosyl 1,2-cyclic phosphodiesterase